MFAFNDPADIYERPVCEDCKEPIPDGDNYTHCTGCCFHSGRIEPMLGLHDDPAREDPSSGTCGECGADVHIENDGEGYVWVLS